MIRFLMMLPSMVLAWLARLDHRIRMRTAPAWQSAQRFAASCARVAVGVIVLGGLGFGGLAYASGGGGNAWTIIRISYLRAKTTTGIIYENSAGTDLLQLDGDASDSTFTVTNMSSSAFEIDNGSNCSQFANADASQYFIFCPTGETSTTRVLHSAAGLKIGAAASLPSTFTYGRCVSAVINYPSIAANSTNTQLLLAGSFTPTTPCVLGCPDAACHALHIVGTCYVDAAGDIYARLANPSAAAQDPASATYDACILDF